MKAVIYNKRGSPDKLVYDDIDKPSPRDDQVLIKVFSVSGNAADYRSMKMGIIPKNRIFGSAIAGIIENVGKNVRGFKPGDEVIADLSDYGFGGFAEYVRTPSPILVLKPEKISFEMAAAIPVAATTALRAVRDKGAVMKGEQVLIVGSSGAVGTFAVQFASYYGAIITGVCSTKNVEQTSALGADRIIDYTKEDFTKGNERYDVILAINGNYSLLAYRRLLKPGGRYVMVGGGMAQIFKSILFGRLLSSGSKQMLTTPGKAKREDLEYAVELVETGHIKPIIEKRFSLKETATAMTYLSSGHARGKVVINVI